MAKAPVTLPDSPVAETVRPPLSVAEAAKKVGVGEDEVFSFRDYGSHVVVVTRAGHKLDSRKVTLPKAEKPEAE